MNLYLRDEGDASWTAQNVDRYSAEARLDRIKRLLNEADKILLPKEPRVYL